MRASGRRIVSVTNQENPDSRSWDWSRDAAQRSVLQAALARGVTEVELFANAPMWWMTHEKSSAGGRLQSWNHVDFARYLATVAARARTAWGVAGKLSVEPFNEPSAGWWKYPKNQEGCNLAVGPQAEILAALRNYGSAQVVRYDLSAFARHGMVAHVTYTQASGATPFARVELPIVDHRVELSAKPNAVYSLTIEGVAR